MEVVNNVIKSVHSSDLTSKIYRIHIDRIESMQRRFFRNHRIRWDYQNVRNNFRDESFTITLESLLRNSLVNSHEVLELIDFYIPCGEDFYPY